MLEYYLIKNCAPTLSRLKISNLFSFPGKITYKEIKDFNRILNSIDINILPLRINNTSLIFVYNQKQLKEYINKKSISCFLSDYGYSSDLIKSIDMLKKSLSDKNNFPHEIGVFLGYPLDDVTGFINNKGKNYIFAGEWKVYANEKARRDDFKVYKNCKSEYIHLYTKGKTISEIIQIKKDKPYI